MPRAPSAESDLSLSRVNRLLRPLRSKCAALTAGTGTSADPYTRSRITDYARATGKGGEWATEDAPPLAIFDDPKKLAGRALDRRSMMNMRSCKLVHDVVEAWKNILQAALPSSPPASANCHVQSLTSMCAAVVGRCMVNEVMDELDTRDSDSEDDESDAEGAEMAAIQELYEAVPLRLRSWTLISHSLSLLLSACPHNPTLLSCLLDLALSHGLVQESRSILSAFLSLCVRPASVNMAPPLAHPSHTEFLKDLCSRWTTFPIPKHSPAPHISPKDANDNPHFSKTTFVDIFVVTLVDAQCHEAWTCKATARFARELRQSDPPTYATLCLGLTDALTQTAPTSDDERPERLALWLDNLPEACYQAGEDSYTTMMRLLCTAQAAGLHCIDTTRLAADSPMRMLQSSLTCTAVKCLSTPSMPSSDHMRGRVVALLRSSPTTATLDNVVGPCFNITSTAAEPPASSPALVNTLETITQRLHVIASALCDQSLARLEMSLWACALRHFQRLKLPEGSNNRASSAFRQTLNDARTAAEGRRAAEDALVECLFLQRPSSPAPQPPSPMPKLLQVPDKPRRALGSVTSAPVHRPMRFQSASTTVSPITTPRKPRTAARTRTSRSPAASPLQAKRAPCSESLQASTFLLASLKTISLKLLEHGSSDDCGEKDVPAASATPRAKRRARSKAPRKADASDSGSEWGREHGLRSMKRRRSATTPRARRKETTDGSDAEDDDRPLIKRSRGPATPRARLPVYAESSSDSESEDSGSDWAREHHAQMTQRRGVAASRGRYHKKSDNKSDSGSDWERSRRARPRKVSQAGGSAPVQREGRARLTLKHRVSEGAARSSRESDESSHSAQSPALFKSLLAEAARRRVSLRDAPASNSSRAIRRRRVVLDSEDESGLDGHAHARESDIEIVVDVPTVKAYDRGSNATGDDALNLFMYE